MTIMIIIIANYGVIKSKFFTANVDKKETVLPTHFFFIIHTFSQFFTIISNKLKYIKWQKLTKKICESKNKRVENTNLKLFLGKLTCESVGVLMAKVSKNQYLSQFGSSLPFLSETPHIEIKKQHN